MISIFLWSFLLKGKGIFSAGIIVPITHSSLVTLFSWVPKKCLDIYLTSFQSRVEEWKLVTFWSFCKILCFEVPFSLVYTITSLISQGISISVIWNMRLFQLYSGEPWHIKGFVLMKIFQYLLNRRAKPRMYACTNHFSISNCLGMT